MDELAIQKKENLAR
jgi:hypothetical protein